MRNPFANSCVCLIAVLGGIGPALAAPDSSGVQIIRDSGVSAGLAVHLGTTDGSLEIELVRGGFRCVQGLAPDDAARDRARRAIEAKGLYGRGAVETIRDPKELPFADNLVNLVVADLDALGDKAPSRREIERALVPRGVAFLKQGGRWSRTVKPRPAEMDDWTHPFHGPDEGKSSRDRLVGAPAGVQWLAGPIFALAERKSSTESVVSAGGRLFLMTQNEPDNLESKRKPRLNYLVARDAFNGLLLWERESRGRHLAKSGAVNPRLVASERHLYVVEDEKLVALDAATGKLLLTYRTDSFPNKFLLSNNLVIVECKNSVTAFAADSAERKWHHAAAHPVSGTLANERHVCFFETDRDEGRFLTVVDLESGKQQWRKRLQDGSVVPSAKSYLDVVVLQSDVLGLLSQEVLQVLSLRDGKELWRREVGDNKNGLAYVASGRIWLLDKAHLYGLDPRTGEEKQKVVSPGKVDMCQPFFVTGHFVVDPRHPTLVDLRSGEKTTFDVARGGCGVGFVAANGLLYTVPTACACYRDMLRGFVSLTPARREPRGDIVRLEKGPAYSDTDLKSAAARPEEWPTYRHDPLRSGATPSAVPGRLRELWKARVGDASSETSADWQLRVGAAITAPVIAGGKVFIAVPDAHRLTALDAGTGKAVWQFTAGGRIDSPPTLSGDLCLFGAHDGWTYCVRAADGKLIWRHLTAPLDQRIVAHGQPESVWPVLSSILVHDGVAYSAAGRAPGADGGIHVHALEPRTGKLLWSKTITSGNRKGLCDLLVSTGDGLWVAGHHLDWKTGASRDRSRDANFLRGGPAGLLEASWTRTPLGLRKGIQTWTYGDAAGQLLAFSDGQAYGYVTASGKFGRTGGDDTLFAQGVKEWKSTVPGPLQVEALSATKSHLLAAGPRDRGNRGKGGGFLRSITLADGGTAADVRLAAPPIYDGLAAAHGRVYLATEDGQLICFGE